MSAIFGIAPRVKTLESIMGRRQKNVFDESLGLARSFSPRTLVLRARFDRYYLYFTFSRKNVIASLPEQKLV